MKKVTLSAVAALFAIGAAFAGTAAQAGHYLWSEQSQVFVKLNQAPTQQQIDENCPEGTLQDCYYTLDETGTVKNVIVFRQ